MTWRLGANEWIYQRKRSGGAMGCYRASSAKTLPRKQNTRSHALCGFMGDTGRYNKTYPHGKIKTGAERKSKIRMSVIRKKGGQVVLQDIIAFLVGVIGLAINFTTMILIFPSKRSLRFTICTFVLFAACFYAVVYKFGYLIPGNGFLTGLAYLPILIWLFQGKLFQKTFAIFFIFFALILQVSLATLIGGAFSGDSNAEFVVYTVSLLLMHAAYIIWMWRYGRHIFARLFMSGSSAEWAI